MLESKKFQQGLLGSVYLLSMIAALEHAHRLTPKKHAYAAEIMHVLALPIALNTSMVMGNKKYSDFVKHGRAGMHGIALGFSVGAADLLITKVFSTIDSPQWGWQIYSKRDLWSSVAFFAASHAAVAINEEIVFRGVGVDLWEPVIGRNNTIILLSILFAMIHNAAGIPPLFSYASFAMLLHRLRTNSQSIVMPMGYHWAWNIWQTAIFGQEVIRRNYKTPVRPSIRPIKIVEAPTWIGTSEPEHGILVLILNCLVMYLLWWRKRRG